MKPPNVNWPICAAGGGFPPVPDDGNIALESISKLFSYVSFARNMSWGARNANSKDDARKFVQCGDSIQRETMIPSAGGFFWGQLGTQHLSNDAAPL